MASEKERILVVENDPEIRVQIAYKSLIPLGYKVSVVHDVNDAINDLKVFSPDVILVNINMPGLSAKDLLVAASSQGIQASCIVVAREGQEKDILQAIRVGAEDYIIWPARDTEIVAVVERCLLKSRSIRDSNGLNMELKETIQNSKKNIQELKILLAFCKSMLSIRDQKELMARVLEGASHLCASDLGWIYAYDFEYGTYRLAAEWHLPELWIKKLGTTMDDGISTLVAMSGESLALNGVSLKRFKIANLGQAAAVIPIKAMNKVNGLIVLVRNGNVPFEKNKMKMGEFIAEMTALVLTRLQDSPS
ncbi:MAG TPA: response regulator [Anaerolineales bacterium]|nr:response regulator [Anaerolineales bacterium]